MADLIFRDEVYAIQGSIFEVYKEMGVDSLSQFTKNA